MSMFSALGRFAYRHRYPVLAGWVALAALMFIFAPKLSQVGVTDQSQFLPQNSESTIANNLLETKFAASSREAPSSAIVVVYDQAGLNQQDMDRARTLRDWLISPEAPAAVSRVVSVFDSEALRSTLVSADNTTMLITVDFSSSALSAASRQALQAIRTEIATLPGTTFYVTGDAGLLIDLFDSVQNAVNRTTLVTVILVIVLLLIVYRSPSSHAFTPGGHRFQLCRGTGDRRVHGRGGGRHFDGGRRLPGGDHLRRRDGLLSLYRLALS